MLDQGFWHLGDVKDGELEAELRELVRAGRRVEARVVAHLAEVDARRLHLRARVTSLFGYCQKELGLSEMEAFYRITAARLARRYPVIFELLEQGRVHLTGLVTVRHYVTAENHAELLEAICGKSKREIAELLATRFPRADVPERLQRLPQIEPLSPGRYKLELTISRELKEKLELARDLTSHGNPQGDLVRVIEQAIDPFIERAMARRFGSRRVARVGKANPTEHGATEHGATEHGATAPTERRRHIGMAVRAEVLRRDGPRCTFQAPDGTRCEARAFLQLHHGVGWAKGGRDTAENLQVMCRAHNQLLAELEYGADHIARRILRRAGH